MFDIGFWELIVIGVLSLIILGPDKMPTAIRSVRGWMRSAREISQNIKSEINEELRAHELHEKLKQAEQKGLNNLAPDLQDAVDELKDAAKSVQRPFEQTPTTPPKSKDS